MSNFDDEQIRSSQADGVDGGHEWRSASRKWRAWMEKLRKKGISNSHSLRYSPDLAQLSNSVA